MINLIKADFKKISYLPAYRYLLLSTIALSILFGTLFLFTTNVTQGKELAEFSSTEVIDISLLGMDVSAIMLILFTAIFVTKDLSSGAVHTNLAITPVRRKYFLSKISFISILSVLISVVLLILFLLIDQFVLSVYGIGGLSLIDILTKLIGSIIMVLFYSLLSVAGTFFLQSTFGGIAFALAAMFLPALIKMFPADVSNMLLPIFPEKSLNAFIDTTNGSLGSAILVLFLWVLISSVAGLWKFNRIDY